MIDLPADIEDRAAYPLVAEDERWIFNKLILAEKLGHRCGPAGTAAPRGVYCVRPVMNCSGMGHGGVLKAKTDGVTDLPFQAGYFWCEWFEGVHGWTDFTNDVATDEAIGTPGRDRFDYTPHVAGQPFVFDTLPVILQGLSTNLLVEHIDGNIIEVSPRHMPWTHGRGTSYFERVRGSEHGWGRPGGDIEDSFYWRSLPL